MAQEFDERFPQRPPCRGVGCSDVSNRVQREHGADPHHLRSLKQHVLATESRHAIVPDGCQQLLDIGVSYELQSHISK